MPGDDKEKFANLRALYGYMFTHPGGKLLFMGCEFGQTSEWNFKKELPWELLQYDSHKGLQMLVKDLNNLYTSSPAMHEFQFDSKGFEWLDFSHHEASIIAYMRKSDNKDETLIVICNFNMQNHEGYRYGVPQKGNWEMIINTDDEKYWGHGFNKKVNYKAESKASHGKVFSIEINIPAMCVMVLRLEK
jgi:1,4-alpha-glucan branching enzyme